MTSPLRTTTWSNDHVKWIDITNPPQEDLKEFSKQFNLDYYTLADCLETGHLPKREALPNFTFLILRVYNENAKRNPASIQEMSDKIAIFYNEKVILTIHKVHAVIMDEIRTSWADTGNITETSEIVTRIMWHVVKSFEPIALELSKTIDYMEKQVFVGRFNRVSLEQLYYIKNNARLNRRIISLSKDLILQHITTPKDASAFQDVKDLLQKMSLYFDEAHDDAANLSTVYLSVVSVRTNDVMKLLTVISVFFMPITFIVGVYGMNFENMPELHWKYGYPAVMGMMSLITLAVFIWFRKRRIF